MLLKIKIVPKPRMIKSDSWKRRPVVMRYWSFVNEVHAAVAVEPEYVNLSGSLRMIFRIPMPTSWSKKRRHEMDGKPHLQKPDLDNLEKSMIDALFPNNDSFVWNIHATKVWSRVGEVFIENLSEYSDRAGYDDEYFTNKQE